MLVLGGVSSAGSPAVSLHVPRADSSGPACNHAQVTGNLDAVQALLRAGASIMVKSGECRAHLQQSPGSAIAARCQAAGRAECAAPLAAALAHSRNPGCCSHLNADGEAYIGEDYLVPGSTPLHVAVIINNISIVHAILQARLGLGCCRHSTRCRAWVWRADCRLQVHARFAHPPFLPCLTGIQPVCFAA